MKKYSIIVRQSLVILITLLAGMGAGFFLFSGNGQKTTPQVSTESSSGAEEEVIWTCSMHPQIRQPEQGLCPLCDMDLIPLNEGESESPLQFVMSAEALRLADIRTESVNRIDAGAAPVTLYGIIEADERRESVEVAQFPGRIEHLNAKLVGERVRKGQRIATVFSPELISAQRELREALKFEAEYPALAEAARQKLRSWKIPESQIRELETGETVVDRFPILAEQSGTLTDLFVSEGDFIKSGQRLFSLNDLNRVWISMDAYPETLPLIFEGDSVTVSGPSLQGETVHGIITFIDPIVDPSSGVGTVRAEMANPKARLKPGMSVTASLKPRKTAAKSVLAIPGSAVLWTGRRSVVYVKIPGSEPAVFEYREITLGTRTGSSYEVLSGVEEGEVVVVNGAFRIDAAAQLSNRQSMMNAMIEQAGSQTTEADWASQLPEAFRQELGTLTDQYLRLKDALVESDYQQTDIVAEALMQALQDISDFSLEEEPRLYWNKQREALLLHIASLRQAEDLESQRTQFEWISNLMIKITKTMQPGTKKLYIQHCPMAFNDLGADWISDEPGILNPYFGDAMLRCGFVTDTLQ